MRSRRHLAVRSVLEQLEGRLFLAGDLPHFGNPPGAAAGPRIGGVNAEPGITGWTLLNGDTNAPIATFSHGAVIDLAQLPTTNLNIQAETTGDPSGVRFGFNGTANFRIDNSANGPFSLMPDTPGSWTPTAGTYAIAGTPVFNGADGESTAVVIRFVDPTAGNKLGISNNSLDLGTGVVGQPRTEQITLSNLGQSTDPAITINSILIDGANASDFSTDFNGAVTLTPGQTRTVTVTFTPGAAGSRAASLTITHSGSNSPATVALAGAGQAVGSNVGRQVVDLDSSWKFKRGDTANAQAVNFDDSTWSTLDLPHTWNAQDGQDGGDDFFQGNSWYRKHITPAANLAGSQMYLKFEGGFLETEVFVNGVSVGNHKGGFGAFVFDVTGKLIAGQDNVVAVRVDNRNNNEIAPLDMTTVIDEGPDFTFFGGLYRGVDLIATNPVHIATTDYASSGVYLKQSNVSNSSATVQVLTKLKNDSATPRTVNVRVELLEADGDLVQEVTGSQTLAAGQSLDSTQTINVLNPRLWNGTIDPYLYDVRVTVIDGSTQIDQVTQQLGLRYYRVDPAQGFFLNGQPYRLNGVAYHQDRINKGWAKSDDDTAQDIGLMKEMGVNFVRLVHYQHSESTYDELDRAGIINWSEIPLVYNGVASPAFQNNLKDQLRELIRQNFNHPSMIFIGLFNGLESDAVHDQLIPELHAVAKAEDPTRLTTAAMVTRAGIDAKVNHVTDVIGYNNYFGWYRGSIGDITTYGDDFRDAYPNRPFGIAEYGAGASIQQHQEGNAKPDPKGHVHPESYQNYFHEEQWDRLKDMDYLWATTIFSMFDFATDNRDEGDTEGRNDKGLVTFDRQTKKDAFYFYKSNWTDTPTVHIADGRYTQRPDNNADVKIYSNLDSVTLKVNGVVIGTSTGDDINVFRFNAVQLQSGANTIEATGTRNGQTVTDTVTWNV